MERTSVIFASESNSSMPNHNYIEPLRNIP